MYRLTCLMGMDILARGATLSFFLSPFIERIVYSEMKEVAPVEQILSFWSRTFFHCLPFNNGGKSTKHIPSTCRTCLHVDFFMLWCSWCLSNSKLWYQRVNESVKTCINGMTKWQLSWKETNNSPSYWQHWNFLTCIWKLPKWRQLIP